MGGGMSGDLWQMARNGTTLLPSEVKKLAADYDRLRRILGALKEPSGSVVSDVIEENYPHLQLWPIQHDLIQQKAYEVTRIILAAVAAAEVEADR